MATRDRPILFSGEMVRAILDGRKTQTRRVIRPQPEYYRHDTEGWELARTENHRPVYRATFARLYCPYGAPVDRLWVRETFSIESYGAGVAQIRYKADGQRGRACGVSDRKLPARIGGVPSIHMPRHCSRLTLEVTDVRVERVQDISEADAEAEGVLPIPSHLTSVDYITPFADLWDKINAKRGYSWAANPWVWVVEFRRVDK